MQNTVIIQGRFVADPEIKRTNSGDFCAFTLASQRGRDKAGNMITDFAPCMAWGRTADFVKGHFKKGAEVIITGRFQSRNYKGADGASHVAYDIFVMQCEFCGPRVPAAPAVVHYSTKKAIEEDYNSINWDEIPDLPESF